MAPKGDYEVARSAEEFRSERRSGFRSGLVRHVEGLDWLIG